MVQWFFPLAKLHLINLLVIGVINGLKNSFASDFWFIFAPLAWLVGVQDEILAFGQLIGTKTFATEFFAAWNLRI